MTIELVDALLALAPNTGRFRIRYINATGRTLTLDDTSAGCICTPSAGNTELIIPTFATLGWTRLTTGDIIELVYSFQNVGTGFVSVVSSQAVVGTDDVAIDWRGMPPNSWAQNGDIVSIRTNGVNSWVRM